MRIIAVEGIDASGKETQVKRLVESLRVMGYKACWDAFPRYNVAIGQWVKSGLTGRVDMTPEALHLLYEVDRVDFQADIKALEDMGYDFLVLDRYILSNLAYGMAKGLDLDWLKAVQSKLRKPDLTFVMDISAETSMKRKPKREDKHEEDSRLLNRARMAYTFLAGQLSEINGEDALIYVIDANNEPDDVHEMMIDITKLSFGG